MKNNLGCEKEIKINTPYGFICGVPNAWGTERLCESCDFKIRLKWKKEDEEREKNKNLNIVNKLKGGKK